MKSISKIWEFILDKILDRRVSVTKLAKPEDLAISNVPLKNIKRGIRRVYEQININERKNWRDTKIL